jgi:hypothetical protein
MKYIFKQVTFHKAEMVVANLREPNFGGLQHPLNELNRFSTYNTINCN